MAARSVQERAFHDYFPPLLPPPTPPTLLKGGSINGRNKAPYGGAMKNLPKDPTPSAGNCQPMRGIGGVVPGVCVCVHERERKNQLQRPDAANNPGQKAPIGVETDPRSVTKESRFCAACCPVPRNVWLCKSKHGLANEAVEKSDPSIHPSIGPSDPVANRGCG
ncbi:hypothetical protein ZHAS_00007204 [Anopheles sinensis]|uniref:Uncharacterized protein n=1 Tax=Anopheles sinensis TaxID=74873 RepID=A0A084VPE0_ANOSI|nr:hypothetical protein ZHAS_00007204 [Anopheles sinensis]